MHEPVHRLVVEQADNLALQSRHVAQMNHYSPDNPLTVQSPDVVLVMMPFGPENMPSLGLSLLAQMLKNADISVLVEYPIVDFYRKVGSRNYGLISNAHGKLMLPEWIFSRFVDPIGTVDDFLEQYRATSNAFQQRSDELRSLADKAVLVAGQLIADYAAKIVKLQPRVVGFSTSFQQQMSSLALAKRIRALAPDIKIVFGGANCSSPMGEQTFLSYPVLDALVVGPGEIAFPRLVRHILDGTTDIRIPGVYWRDSPNAPLPADPGIAPEPAMDDLPYPDYDDFFAIWPADSIARPFVPLEGSRGCWWGQKQHCVFCSLNHDINYRSKNPERFYQELLYLHERYPGLQLFATDDILDLRLVGTITERLAGLPVRPKLYYSIKSNIRKDQLQALARAGVNAIQPGIESLADEVLQKMRKGVTGLRNIQLLKWAHELGLKVSWSILYGFPFDEAEPYNRMTRWLPSLAHIPPPRGFTDVRIQRYSPLYFQADNFGVKNLRPRKFYSLIYNVDPAAIERLAYNFDWDLPRDQGAYIEPLRKEVVAWMAAARANSATLSYADHGNKLEVLDTRPTAVRAIHRLGEVERVVCLACDQVAKRHQIESALLEAGFGEQTCKIDAMLARFVEDRLMLSHNDFYLFLPCAEQSAALQPADVVRPAIAAAS